MLKRKERKVVKMFETFEKLPESKRQQILQVCIEEFVENGYKNASTNTIVNRLGISKGVLFLYFKNKKSLYLYLVEYISKILTEVYLNKFRDGLATVDVFDNIGEFYKTELQAHPELLLFMLDAFLNAPDELRGEVEESHERAHDYVLHYLSNSRFREGVDVRLLVNLIHMISYHLGQLIFEEYKNKKIDKSDKLEIEHNIDHFAEIFGKYMDILKYGVLE